MRLRKFILPANAEGQHEEVQQADRGVMSIASNQCVRRPMFPLVVIILVFVDKILRAVESPLVAGRADYF